MCVRRQQGVPGMVDLVEVEGWVRWGKVGKRLGGMYLGLEAGQFVVVSQKLLLEGVRAGRGLGRRSESGRQGVEFVAVASVTGLGGVVCRGATCGVGRTGRGKGGSRVGEGALLPGDFLAESPEFFVASGVVLGQGGNGGGGGIGACCLVDGLDV